MKNLILVVLAIFTPLAFAGGPLIDNSHKQQQQQTAVGVGVGIGVAGSKSKSDNAVTVIDEATDAVASSAPAIYSAGCQVGATGQVKDGGLALIVDDPICSNLKLADAYNSQIEHCNTNECIVAAVEMRNHHLAMASQHAESTSSSSHWAKEGVEVGTGALGYGALVGVCWLAGGPVGATVCGLGAAVTAVD